MVIVDDSTDVDSEIFDMEEYEGAEWVLITDDTPVDEARRDELLESFQVDHHASPLSEHLDEPDEELAPDEDEELE